MKQLNAANVDKRLNLAYRQVVQARAERKLVNLMIRRHEKGQAGDYILDASSDDPIKGYNSLQQNYPAHYYKQVSVCSNCYKMYTTIDESREKSLQKIRAGKEGGGAVSPSTRRRSRPASRPTNTHFAETGAAMDDTPPLSARAVALQRAQTAIGALTKTDVAELRAFSSPPAAAVQLVTSAVMLLITGEALPWGASKRIMAILNMLLAVDENNIKGSRLKTLRQMITQPAIHPDVLESVSTVAARFAAFVMGVVQYASYKNGDAHA